MCPHFFRLYHPNLGGWLWVMLRVGCCTTTINACEKYWPNMPNSFHPCQHINTCHSTPNPSTPTHAYLSNLAVNVNKWCTILDVGNCFNLDKIWTNRHGGTIGKEIDASCPHFFCLQHLNFGGNLCVMLQVWWYNTTRISLSCRSVAVGMCAAHFLPSWMWRIASIGQNMWKQSWRNECKRNWYCWVIFFNVHRGQLNRDLRCKLQRRICDDNYARKKFVPKFIYL
jgi:hypothetical protein